jgi:hypothetical protein
VHVDLQTLTVGIVHQEETGSIIRREISDADVLTIPSEIGTRQCLIIQYSQESDGV